MLGRPLPARPERRRRARWRRSTSPWPRQRPEPSMSLNPCPKSARSTQLRQAVLDCQSQTKIGKRRLTLLATQSCPGVAVKCGESGGRGPGECLAPARVHRPDWSRRTHDGEQHREPLRGPSFCASNQALVHQRGESRPRRLDLGRLWPPPPVLEDRWSNGHQLRRALIVDEQLIAPADRLPQSALSVGQVPALRLPRRRASRTAPTNPTVRTR